MHPSQSGFELIRLTMYLENDLEVLILPPSPKDRDDRRANPCLVYTVLGIEPRACRAVGRQSINVVTSPALSILTGR